ncbi:hypothetical protein J4217_00200 [Candidatus Pacearchaeota archaeon]|nr:hypothetical protein [Candidatus Pacearchaeota archaeon]
MGKVIRGALFGAVLGGFFALVTLPWSKSYQTQNLEREIVAYKLGNYENADRYNELQAELMESKRTSAISYCLVMGSLGALVGAGVSYKTKKKSICLNCSAASCVSREAFHAQNKKTLENKIRGLTFGK